MHFSSKPIRTPVEKQQGLQTHTHTHTQVLHSSKWRCTLDTPNPLTSPPPVPLSPPPHVLISSLPHSQTSAGCTRQREKTRNKTET
ncbi:hypothetical protein F7725_006929 [Dissostichus mawsoni]|uniref:Uncharacterized protein n=1 Tax=Dissostichus mawsoni TaxID=36200 RepID=A0A7J5XWX9_DISMA|nr:hypothetical protein F7725_006929 [Dissostichus mawsoni]